jgi:hypothetical protein
LEKDADGVLHGWCWNETAPAERQAVEILLDGAVVTGTIAARFRADLRQNAIGDGYHGFQISLSKTLANGGTHHIITARERRTATIFGRVVMPDAGFPPQLRDRLRNVAAGLAAAQAATETLARASRGSDTLVAATRALGEHLLVRAGRPHEAVYAHYETITLPVAARPAVSLLMRTQIGARATLHAIRAAAPGLVRAGVELLLIDDGADPWISLLPGAIDGMRYVNTRGQPHAAGYNRAAAQARGATLVLLDLTQDFAAGLAAFETPLPENTLLAGSAAIAAARRFRPDLATSIACHTEPAPPCLHLAMPRAMFTRLGGLAPHDAALAAADMVLHATVAGESVMEWRPAWRPHGAADTGLRAVDGAAWRGFAARWGLPA